MQVFRQILHEYQFKCFGILGRDCRLMFSLRAKQRPIPSITASDPSKLQFYIGFRQFRPDYLSVFHDEDTVPPTRAPHWLQVSVSGSRQTHPLFYPVRQLNHVCRVDAEEDIQDFRPLRPSPKTPQKPQYQNSLTQLPQPQQKAPQTTRTTKLPSRRLRSMPLQTDHLQDTCQ